jgi:oxygen-dependent protoporphyrinogen oxidase
MSKVIVVGGGIAGLGAAYTLQKAGVEVLVLEAGSEPGGRVRSRQWGGAWIDLGAEFFPDADLQYLNPLIDELGLREQLITYPGAKLKMEIWRDGKAHPLALTEISSFAGFTGMSALGKLQMLRLLPTMLQQFRRNGDEAYQPWRAAWCDDESMESWLGRLAPEFLEYAIEPSYELYCGWEPHDTGKGVFAYLMTTYRQTSMITMKQGLGQFTRTLASHLNVKTNAKVTCVAAGTRPVTVEFQYDGRHEREQADFVIVAVPGSKVSHMVAGLDPARRAFFEGVRYTPHELHFFTLSGKPQGIPARLFFPRNEDRCLASIGYDAASTDPQVSFLRADLKTVFTRSILDKSDEENLSATVSEVERRYPHIKPMIKQGFVSRWREALPIFWPGYCKALETFVNLPAQPGIAFAGDYLAGNSTGSAYVSGQRAAAQALRQLG